MRESVCACVIVCAEGSARAACRRTAPYSIVPASLPGRRRPAAIPSLYGQARCWRANRIHVQYIVRTVTAGEKKRLRRWQPACTVPPPPPPPAPGMHCVSGIRDRTVTLQRRGGGCAAALARSGWAAASTLRIRRYVSHGQRRGSRLWARPWVQCSAAAAAVRPRDGERDSANTDPYSHSN